MKHLLIGMSLFMALFAVSCSKDDDNDDDDFTPDTDTVLRGDITNNRTLRSGNTYMLDGVVYVKNGATLTIEPGVTVKARVGKTCLVITRGSKIDAAGTADRPIVFTSEAAQPTYGSWGGIVLLGRARTNAAFNGQQGVGEIEGGVNNAAGDGLYGGQDDNDNSGRLRYIRIEYGGYAFLPDRELNSLTMGAVGSQTEIDYVICSYGLDDAFEWFGGSVNARHLIAYRALDDDFDCDFGYHGNIQFGIVVRDPNQADVSGSNGLEQDNDATGSDAMPYTAPVFSNITVVGPLANSGTSINANYKRAAHLRRNTRTSIFNSIMIGYPTGILLDGSKVAQNLVSGAMEIRNNIIAGANKSIDTIGASGVGVNLMDIIMAGGNLMLTNTTDVQLSAPYESGSTFNPTPTAGSPAASGASFSSSKLTTTFFSQTAYRGAANPNGGEQWWKGWSGL